MKKTIILLCAIAAFCASGAVKMKNLNDKMHLSGDKITEADLIGKAVLIYYWDVAEPASVMCLSEIEKAWNTFKTKKFLVIGTYYGTRDDDKIKAAIAKHKVTFPVYYKACLDPDPKTGWTKPPYFCALNHRGVVVYSGGSVKAMMAKAVESIGAIGMPVALCNDVTFKKFKGISGQLKLGKNLTAIMKKLEKESHSKDPNVSAEAQEILSGIDIAREEVKADIDMYREIDPAEAMKIVDLFLKTWPKDESAAELKASLKDLKKAAKDKAKASKDKPEKEENEEKEK